MKNYVAYAAKNPEQHRGFLRQLKKWIEDYRPGRRIKDKKELQAVRSLDVVEKSGLRMLGKKQFVQVEFWDTEVYGPLPEKAIVEQKIQGQIVRGVWRRTGKEGHWDAEEYEDIGLEHRSREASSEGIFGDEQMKTKEKVLKAALVGELRTREKNTVEGGTSLDNLMEKVALLTGSASARPEEPENTKAASCQDEGEKGTSSSSNTSDSSSEETGEDARTRLSRVFSSKAQAETKSSSAKPSAKKQTLGKKGSGGNVGTKRAPSNQSAGAGGVSKGRRGGSADVMELDGRGQRFKETLANELREMRCTLSSESLAEQCLPETSKETWTDFCNVLQKRAKVLQSIEVKTKNLKQRVLDSPNVSLLGAEAKALDSVLAETVAKKNMCKVAKARPPMPDDVLSAGEACNDAGVDLGWHYHLLIMRARAAKTLMFANVDEFVQLFYLQSPEVLSSSNEKTGGARCKVRCGSLFWIWVSLILRSPPRTPEKGYLWCDYFVVTRLSDFRISYCQWQLFG